MESDDQIYILDEEMIELNNNVVNENTKKGDSPHRPVIVANSSSDDDEKSEPLVKKKRATRRPRKKAQRTSESKENYAGLGIYGSAINECYKKIESGLWSSVARLSSDEEDVNNNKLWAGDRPIADHCQKQRKSPRKLAQPRAPLYSPCVEPDVITVRDRSPSPPPTPEARANHVVNRRRGPRRPKAVKQALAEIQAIKRTMPPLNDSRRNSSPGDYSFDASLMDDLCADEITVKIRSRSGIERFTMKSTEPFMGVFEKFAAREGVSVEQCMMFRDDDNIEPYMTPASAKITVADIIGFCIRAEVEEDRGDISSDDPNGIQLQVQATGLKHKTKVSLLRTEPLLKVMLEFARQQNRDVDSIKFYFDGELVKQSNTPQDLDMEDMECLDAVFL